MPEIIRSKVPTIGDFEQKVKIYPYALTGSKKSDFFVAPNTYSIIAISQSPIANVVSRILKDENNNLYFEAILSQRDDVIVNSKSSTDIVASKLDKSTSGMFVSNNFPSLVEEHMIFTIGIPINLDNVKNNKQNVFWLSNVIEPEPLTIHELQFALNKESYVEISYINFNNFINQFTNADYQFYFNDSGILENVSQIKVETNKSLGINRIAGRGYSNNSNVPIHLQANGNFAVIRAYPIDVDSNRITMRLDWFDDSRFLSYKVIKDHLTSATSLNDLLGTYFDASLKTKVVNLINDMIAISYAVNSQFKDFTQDQNGNFTPSYIGNAKLVVKNIFNKTAQSINDGLYDKFIAEENDLTSSQKRLITAFIASLSRYIISSFSFAGGNNDAVCSLAPWYLFPNATITLTSSGSGSDTTKIFSGVDYIIKSNWYGDGVVLLQNIDLSKIRNIFVEQFVDIPKVPKVFVNLDKTSLAGNMMKSNQDLMYMFYIPATNTDIEKFYGNTQVINTGTVVDWSNEQVGLSDWGIWIGDDTNKWKQLITQYANTHLPLGTIWDYSDFQLVNIITITDPTNRQEIISSVYTNFDTTLPITNWTNQQAIDYLLSKNIANDANAIEIVANAVRVGSVTLASNYTIHNVVIGGITYRLKRQYLSGVKVVVNSSITIPDEIGQTYDYTDFINYINNNGAFGPNNFVYTLNPSITIDRLSEIEVSGAWLFSLKLTIGTYTFQLNMLSKFDETISHFKIVFT